MILESRLNLSRDSWIRKKSRAIKYRAASLIKWVSCIILQVEDKWHCVMPLSSLALLPVLSVRINKAVILGSDMIQCFTVFPPVSLTSLSGCSPPGEGERRHRVHPPLPVPGQGQSRAWPPLHRERNKKPYAFSPRSSPELPWGSAASRGKLVFLCSFPPDEVNLLSRENV